MLRMIGHRVSCAPFVHAREAFGIEKGRVVGVGVRAAAAAAAGGKEGEVSRSSEISIGSGSSGEFVKSLADLYPRLPCRHCKGVYASHHVDVHVVVRLGLESIEQLCPGG